MTGHSEGVHQVLWADAELEGVQIDYDALLLLLRESSGKQTTLRCEGYIGYSCPGFWDEIVIERAELVEDDPFQTQCLAALQQRHGAKPALSGSPERNRGRFRTLRVRFIDGAVLFIVAGAFHAQQRQRGVVERQGV